MIKKIVILITPILAFLLILFLSHTLKYECVFRKYFDFRCAGCGITRSFNELIHFHILESLYYNILTIPIIGSFIYYIYLNVKDIKNHTNDTFKTLIKIWKKYYMIIIIIILITMLINNVHQI